MYNREGANKECGLNYVKGTAIQKNTYRQNTVFY